MLITPSILVLSYLRSIYPETATYSQIAKAVPSIEPYTMRRLASSTKVKLVRLEGVRAKHYQYDNRYRPVEMDAQVYQLLEGKRKGLHYLEIAEILNLNLYTVRGSLDNLEIDGKVNKNQIGITGEYRYTRKLKYKKKDKVSIS